MKGCCTHSQVKLRTQEGDINPDLLDVLVNKLKHPGMNEARIFLVVNRVIQCDCLCHLADNDDCC